jgi:hypothetical protein
MTGTRQDAAPERRQPRRAPSAYVSLLWPTSRRKRWWYLVRCPVCGLPHLGRAVELADVTRTRRLPCGHRVQVAIARTYGRPGGAS